MGEVTVHKDAQNSAMSVSDMQNQVNQIQTMMKKIMKVDVHYGKIPGTGDKSALLKPGAEKIGMLFGLRVEFDVNRFDLPDGHREYEVMATFRSKHGEVIGQGLGTCTTLEKKYRYRNDPTGQVVPPEYWESRDQNVLGGPDFVARKNKGKWMIFQQVEYDCPADYYNTCLKMGKKRAYVDGIITCTAASDFFDQEEVIDTPEHFAGDAQPDHVPNDAPPRTPKPKSSGGDKITQNQLRLVRRRMDDKSIDDGLVCKEFDVKSLEDIAKSDVNSVLVWLDSASN